MAAKCFSSRVLTLLSVDKIPARYRDESSSSSNNKTDTRTYVSLIKGRRGCVLVVFCFSSTLNFFNSVRCAGPCRRRVNRTFRIPPAEHLCGCRCRFIYSFGSPRKRLFFHQKLMCECPWVVKDPETKEMVLERTTLATLVLLVQSPPT